MIKGVRPEYGKQEFYRRQVSEDTSRVNRLFADAEKNLVKVVQKAVSLNDIRLAVHQDGMLILVLVDKHLLRCCMCERSGFFLNDRRIRAQSSSGFLGHYVLLYAYDPNTDTFLMKDPASFAKTCAISAQVLEEARTAFGTDQDVLFIGELE